MTGRSNRLPNLESDVNTVDKNGETAMHGAAYKSLPKVVQLLADKGAKIELWNRKNRYNWTPLLIAVLNGRSEVAEALLSHGSDPNVAYDTDLTLLHMAIMQENVMLVASLLRYGADPTVIDGEGRPMTRYSDSEEIVALLRASEV